MAKRKQISGPGRVYVLVHPMHPTMVKIGKTRRTTELRARELDTTGSALPLIVAWDEYVADPDKLEGELHTQFREARVTGRREFFWLPPKIAIAALIEAAEPRRLLPVRAEGRVELLQRLRQQFGDILRPELTDVALLVTDDGVVLAVSERAGARDVTETRTYLDFIYIDSDTPMFSAENDAEDNALQLLAMDELSLVMCTNLVTQEAAERIDAEQSSYRIGMWLDLDGDPPPF
jgi:hypothetical protein